MRVSKWKGKSLISIDELTKDDILYILKKATKFENDGNGAATHKLADGKILASLFFEPSTRTRLSFEAAMSRLRGHVIGFSDTENTSIVKGESFSDTIKIASSYADILVLRHPVAGAAALSAKIAEPVPVINGGDGANQHPTQTLLDLYTIQKMKGRLSGLEIAIVGDLKYGRTVHSLVYALALFRNRLTFVSPPSLTMPPDFLKTLSEKFNLKYQEATLEEAVKKADVIYATRIQKERFADPKKYEKLKESYTINKKLLSSGKDDLILLHPLPRVNEISPDVDGTKYATYFEQARAGVPVRMALIALLLGLIK